MNLPASLWLLNFSPQIRPLINVLLVTFTMTQWRQVQEYVSQTVLMKISLPCSSTFSLAKLAADDEKFTGSSEEFFCSLAVISIFLFLRAVEIESETMKNSISRPKLYPNPLHRQSESAKRLPPICWQAHSARLLIIYNRTDKILILNSMWFLGTVFD